MSTKQHIQSILQKKWVHLCWVLIGICNLSLTFSNPTNHTMHKYQYVDSANNLYEISELSLSYHPTKPIMSSSGTYDGGEEQQIVLTEERFSSLLQLLDEAFDQTEDHVEQRSMGSSIVKKFTTDNEIHSCMLGYNSPTQKQIQKELEELIAQ